MFAKSRAMHRDDRLCTLCECGPAGREGHGALTAAVAAAGWRLRSKSWLPLDCPDCGAHWVRHRLGPETFEWIRRL
jgi:hypothetical protein